LGDESRWNGEARLRRADMENDDENKISVVRNRDRRGNLRVGGNER